MYDTNRVTDQVARQYTGLRNAHKQALPSSVQRKFPSQLENKASYTAPNTWNNVASDFAQTTNGNTSFESERAKGCGDLELDDHSNGNSNWD